MTLYCPPPCGANPATPLALAPCTCPGYVAPEEVPAG